MECGYFTINHNGDVSSRLKPNTVYRYKIERPQYAKEWHIALFAIPTWGGYGLTVTPAGGWSSDGVLRGNIRTSSAVLPEEDFNYIIVGTKKPVLTYGFTDWENPDHPLPTVEADE